jgi:hypothetical protein
LIILFLGGSAIVTAPKDIFPNINIPVVTVIWQYTGLTPEEMEQYDNLSVRCGACQGWLGRAAEYCAHGWETFGAFDHHQEWKCLDT